MNAATQQNLQRAYQLAHVAADKIAKMYDDEGRVILSKVTSEDVSDALADLQVAQCALRGVKNQLLGNPETLSRQ